MDGPLELNNVLILPIITVYVKDDPRNHTKRTRNEPFVLLRVSLCEFVDRSLPTEADPRNHTKEDESFRYNFAEPFKMVVIRRSSSCDWSYRNI